MFDIGFWELTLIAVMGLVVLGPERLPVAIRTVRSWITGVRKFSDTVKSEVTEELRIHELHSNLKKAEQSNFENLSPEVAASVKSLQDAADMVNQPFKKEFEQSSEQKPLTDNVERNVSKSSAQQTQSNAVSDNSSSEKIEK